MRMSMIGAMALMIASASAQERAVQVRVVVDGAPVASATVMVAAPGADRTDLRRLALGARPAPGTAQVMYLRGPDVTDALGEASIALAGSALVVARAGDRVGLVEVDPASATAVTVTLDRTLEVGRLRVRFAGLSPDDRAVELRIAGEGWRVTGGIAPPTLALDDLPPGRATLTLRRRGREARRSIDIVAWREVELTVAFDE
jgi:hypothetical protein